MSFLQVSEGFCIEKIPFKPRWVSIPKKGRFFKYRRKEFSSPILFQNALYVGSDAGYFLRYDTDGDKVWRIKTGAPVNSTATALQRGEQTIVFFGDDEGFLRAVDGQNGKEIWKSDLGSEVWSAPAITPSGDRLFAVTMEGKIFALNAEDGQMIWQKEYTLPSHSSEFGEIVIRGTADPVLDENRLYVAFADGLFWALSQKDGKVLWEKKLGTQKGFNDIDGPALIEQDRLYTASFEGNLISFSRKEGKILWSQEIGSAVKMLMVHEETKAEKTLFVSGTDSHLYALDPKSGKIIWKLLVGKGALTSPIYYKGIIAVGLSSGTMNFIDAQSGKLIIRRFAKKGISSNPILDDDKIYFLSNGGRLYSLRFKIK